MTGIFFATTDDLEDTLSKMDAVTREWTMRAARMECSWICSDCCYVFPDGMPNECTHGLQWCTDIITRDKIEAKADSKR